jgi:hypothetical protein
VIRNINPLLRRALSMGPPVELVAIRPQTTVTLGGGRALSDAACLPPERLSIRPRWATGAAVIERGDELARLTIVTDGHMYLLAVDGDREIQRPVPGPDDAPAVGVLWAMVETRPTVVELHSCLMLKVALIYHCDPALAVQRWVTGDLDEVVSRMDLPAGEPTVDRLYALAHCLDIPTAHPGPGGDALAALGPVVPPRWVLAERLRSEGHPSLAQVVMGAT